MVSTTGLKIEGSQSSCLKHMSCVSLTLNKVPAIKLLHTFGVCMLNILTFNVHMDMT